MQNPRTLTLDMLHNALAQKTQVFSAGILCALARDPDPLALQVRYRKPGDDSHGQAMADEATMRLA